MMRNEEILAAIRVSLEGRAVKNALIISPDFTRFHSNAGLIAGEYYRLLTGRGAQVDVLPALGTLYFALAGIWNLPMGEEIVGTITALDTFLGVLLGISAVKYHSENS